MKKLFSVIIFFTALSLSAQTALIDRYEYWFNQQVDARVTVNLAPVQQAEVQFSLSTIALPDGLNSFTIRFRDTEGSWSAPLTRFFVKTPITEGGGTQHQIVAWEYRFNQQEMVLQNVTPAESVTIEQMISAAALPDGLNTISMRFKDNSGAWSSMLSRFFVKMPETQEVGEEKQIVGYEYRFNQGESTWQGVTPGTTVNISEILDVDDLPDGLNTFSIRFKDDAGAWSSMLSRFFVKMPVVEQQGETAAITAYQVWFNNDFASLQETSVADETTYSLIQTLEASALPDGLNTVNIRFRDNRGHWSSTLSRFFVKLPGSDTGEPNLMTAYEYWLEDAEGNLFDAFGQEGRTIVELDEPENPMLLDLDLDLRRIPHGDYFLMFRFLDTRGAWSSVIASEIEKNALPFAYFEAEQTIFCGYGEVTFSNFSVDADEFVWGINDGIVSTDPELANYQLNGPGIYTVSLTAIWSETGASHTYTVENMIVVHELPEVLILSDGDTEFCDGGSVILSSNQEGIYLWATGETSAQITVTETGDYWLLLTDENQCEIYVPGVFVTVYELPDAQILLPDNEPWCAGDEIVILAYPETSNNSYLWSTGETTPEITVNQSGNYWVQVTDFYQCTAQSENAEIVFHPLPEAAFSFEVNNYFVSFSNTSQGAVSYLWDFGDGATSTDQNPQHQYSGAGQYEICLKAISEAGCEAIFCQTMSITVGVNDPLWLKGLNAYPVPFDNYLKISLPEGHQWQVIELLNITGQVMLRKEASPGADIFELNTAQWEPGIYMINLFGKDGNRENIKVLKR
jgi:PKD repeat protein